MTGIDYVYEFMKSSGLLTGDRGKDRRTYVELNFCGDVNPDQIPLDAELEADLPEELQNVRPLDEN
jgi:hypothetical protein